MTVSSSTNRASYSGNGSLTTFAYGFKVFDQDDLTVILRASNGTETVQTITTDYTVTGVGDVGGGNVVFGTAPASGVTVVILREMDLEQGLDLVPNDPFPAQSLEDSLDKLTFMVQQHDEQLGRAIKASRTNVITGSEFVISAADRANKVFAFDSSGDVSITQEIGTFRGDWAASTAYVERDLVKDTTTNNVFIVNSAHTSSGSLPLTTNTNSAKYEKIIDITNPPGDLTVGGNISTSGSVTAGNFVIGSADINENDLEAIDSIIAGTVAASKAVVVDVNKDISSFRNLTATGDITFGGLSDGAITVTDILDEDDLTSNSATSLATQQSIKAYVDSQVGSFDTLAEVLANGSTTGGTNLTVSTGDDIKFADGSQAIFGAGDDLRINHNGSYSYISDLGQGPLYIGGNEEVSIMNGQLNEYKIKAETNGAVTLYYDNAVKMATTTLGIDVTGTITFDGGETTADFYFGDNDKAIFGAGSDLAVFSNGTDSFIQEYTTGGHLYVDATNVRIRNRNDNTLRLQTSDSGAVDLYYSGSAKLATTSTGVDITGTLTSDGLTVGGSQTEVKFTTTAGRMDLFLTDTDTTDGQVRVRGDANSLSLITDTKLRQTISSGGDISFYENTGTTPKFFWDASAESLGIGTSSPSDKLHVESSGDTKLKVKTTGTTAASGHSGLALDTGNGGYLLQNLTTANSTHGVLRIYDTANSVERMRIDSSGNVGIGTSSPSAKVMSNVNTFTDADKVAFKGYNNQAVGVYANFQNATTGTGFADGFRLGIDDSENAQLMNGESTAMTFATSATERMRIDASGNLLVGTTNSTPGIGDTDDGAVLGAAGWGFFSKTYSSADSSSVLYVGRNGTDGNIINIAKDGSTVGSIGTQGGSLVVGSDDTGFKTHQGVDGIVPYSPSTNLARDAAIDLGYSTNRFKDLYLSGDSFVGEPSTIGAGETGVTVRGLGQIRVGRSGTASATLVSFNNSNGEVGRISTSGSATSYVTSSDYRLKTDAQPMTGASARVQALNPVNFEWIADGTRVDGFLAHEAQAIVPEAVTGAKDAMRDEEYEVTPAVLDDDGNVVTEAVMGTRSAPDYQGIDQSKLVPLLTAALQEALTKIDALETRITALEG